MKNILTIVIPCKNEENYIGNILKSILGQNNIKDVQIIIADANSTDNTLKIIESFTTLNIKVIQGGLPAIARNNGARISKTKYTLFIDADAEFFDANLICESVNKMESKDLHMLASKLNSSNFKVKILYKMNNFLTILSKLDKPFCTGMYMLVNTEVFFQLGGFDESAMHCEDYLISRLVKNNKFGIINKSVYSDDRRLKKIGYVGMVKYIYKNILNRNNPDYFKKDVNYWL